MFGAAASRRALQVALLVGGLVVLGMVCGARAHAEQGGPSVPVSVPDAAHVPGPSNLGAPNSGHPHRATHRHPAEHTTRHTHRTHRTDRPAEHATHRHPAGHHATHTVSGHVAGHLHHATQAGAGQVHHATHTAPRHHATHATHATHAAPSTHPGSFPGGVATGGAHPSVPSSGAAHRTGSPGPATGRPSGPVLPGSLPHLGHLGHLGHGGAAPRPSAPGAGGTGASGVTDGVRDGVRDAVRDTEGALHDVAVRLVPRLPELPSLPGCPLPGLPGPGGPGGDGPEDPAAQGAHGPGAGGADTGRYASAVLGPPTPVAYGSAAHGAVPSRGGGHVTTSGEEGPGPVPAPLPGGDPAGVLYGAQDAWSGAHHRPGELGALLSGTRVPVLLVPGAMGVEHAAAVRDRYRDILEFPG
ncbi:hypothetical protein [Streptomyces sp. TS71-3]|uniref:hypothetical protein n=1 Tax=Streptomyces sp. TS71-3 TaxID=2733862 RepID=UPI001AFFBA41|nr:hypothetical protein [Streptomyces sp. TS71-3]GHJ35066.1 hypothetical protein Sm713_06750 [Streptomyces sp. TS71-3]